LSLFDGFCGGIKDSNPLPNINLYYY